MMQNLERESWYLGNLAGVPIFLHWTALIMVLMVWGGSTGGGVELFLVYLIALIVGIVLHELGHGLTARAFGAYGITITLWAFGGLCRSSRDSSRIGREIAIVAAGPAVSLALWLGCFELIRQLGRHAPGALGGPGAPSLLFEVLAVSVLVNKSLFIFNMLPIFPMDGGQLVYYGSLGLTRNQLLARKLSLTLAVFGSLAFFCWRSDLFDILAAGGGVGQWIGQLGFNDIVLAVLLSLMLRSAFHVLY